MFWGHTQISTYRAKEYARAEVFTFQCNQAASFRSSITRSLDCLNHGCIATGVQSSEEQLAKQPHQQQPERGEHGSPMYNRSQLSAAGFASCWQPCGSGLHVHLNLRHMRGAPHAGWSCHCLQGVSEETPVRVHRACRRHGPAPECNLLIEHTQQSWR